MGWIRDLADQGLEARHEPARGLFLTPEEVEHLTGLRRGVDQLRWLFEHGFSGVRNASGVVVVSREHVEQRLGVERRPRDAGEPDWSAVA